MQLLQHLLSASPAYSAVAPCGARYHTSARTKLLYTSPGPRSVSSPLAPRVGALASRNAASGSWNSRKAAAEGQERSQRVFPRSFDSVRVEGLGERRAQGKAPRERAEGKIRGRGDSHPISYPSLPNSPLPPWMRFRAFLDGLVRLFV